MSQMSQPGESTRVLMLGAGGIGGYVGGRLVAAGRNVTFLVRPGRQRQLLESGLRIESPLGDLTVPVSARTSDELQGQTFDVVVLTCKAYDLDDALDLVGPLLADDGVLLPLLNGLAHLDTLRARFGAHRVAGGVAQIGVTLTEQGVVRHLSAPASLSYGGWHGQTTEALARWHRSCEGVPGMQAELSTRIEAKLWEKYMLLSVIAGACCLFRANIGAIASTHCGSRLLTNMFDVVFEVGRREGYPPEPGFVARARALCSESTSTTNASMLRDMLAGKNVEAGHIVGDMLRYIRKHDLDDTLFAAAFTLLQTYMRSRTVR